MTKTFFFVFLSLIIFSSSLAHANTSTSSANLQRRQKIKEISTERKEKLDLVREQFKTRLGEIKDTRKQKIVENLDKSYVNINNRWTAHFKNVLERLQKLADKLKTIAQKQNNSEALKALDQVYANIDTVSQAVDTQTANTYTIDLTDETKYKQAAQTVHKQLRTDLESLRDEIQNIREALRKVAATLTLKSTT